MMKSKKNLARKILCGLLTAGVVGVSGSAMAENINYPGKYYSNGALLIGYLSSVNKNNSDVKYQTIGTSGISDIKISVKNSDDKNANAFGLYLNPGGQVTVLGKNIYISAINENKDKYSRALATSVGNGYIKDRLILGDDKTEEITVIAKSKVDPIAIYAWESDVEIKTKKLNINARGENSIGIIVGNSTDYEQAPDNTASINVEADSIEINSEVVGIGAFSNGQMNIVGDLVVNAKNAIDTRGHATTNINTTGQHKTILNGDIVFETPATPENAHGSGYIIDANVNINLTGAKSSWTGSAYQEYKVNDAADEYKHIVELEKIPYHGNVTGLKINLSDGATWNMTGDSFINNVTVGENSAINVKENAKLANLQNAQLDGGTINLQGKNQQVNVVDKFSGTGTVATSSLDNNVKVTSLAEGASISVLGSGDIADAIKSGKSNAQQLANVVTSGSDEEAKSVASEVRTEEGKVAGAFYAKVNDDGSINTQSVVQTENTTNRAISDMASISIMTWRQENNDMNKRLGELRDSKGEHGAWARMARGESKYGAQNVKNQYNYYQVGYDEKLSVNPNWTVGVALTRTEGTSTFTNGSGENKHTGFAVYGSYLNDNGSFVDLIAKYARMDNEYTTSIGAGSGDYETNGYSLSAEYGKRFTKDNGLWIEPQVELTYGRVGAADYVTANGVQARQNDMESLVGRLGFSLGKNIKQGNVYVRASYLYDFDGETDVRMLDTESGAADSYKQDLGGGWWEVGVGTNLNLSEATHLYFDVEKTYGGNVATPWQWNAGVRWSF